MNTARIQFQRDFYRLLLDIPIKKQELHSVLDEALSLIAEISDAKRGYLEVSDTKGNRIFQTFSVANDELENIQNTVSSGIIAEAIRSRTSILLPSAMLDPKFGSRESVQRLAIEAVLCVPFYGSETTGILYLQGDNEFKGEAEKIKLDAELFSLHVSPLLDQLLLEQERILSEDPATELRQQYDLAEIVGSSQSLHATLQSAMMIAPLEVNTLILGETGTGKTQLAKLIHKNSKREASPFVEVNCALLPENLFENEFFGAQKGGHSSATQIIPGKVKSAEGGTLFLDEIGELPLPCQSKLLQFLQSFEYSPLGASKSQFADIRVIFATNVDLNSKVQDGLFREDLYYRISTFELHLPSLADRREDTTELAEHFLQACIRKHKFDNLTLDESCLHVLNQKTLKGNLRELQSIIERACITSVMKGSNVIYATHVSDTGESSRVNRTAEDFQTATLNFQRQLLENKLSETDWNVTKTAKELNLSRSHVHNLINSYRLRKH